LVKAEHQEKVEEAKEKRKAILEKKR